MNVAKENQSPWLLAAAGLLGATAVALGAFAAHGLGNALLGMGYEGDELTKRVDNFVTASRYQLATAVAVLAIGLSPGRGALLRQAGWILVGGVVVFSGLLYALSLTGDAFRFLGAIVPLGGLAMIAGWTLLAFAAFKPAQPSASNAGGWGRSAAKPPADPDRGPHSPEAGGDPDGIAPGRPTLKDEVVRLEEAITHQQQLLQDLNEAVTSMRDETDHTARRQNNIEQTVRRLVDLQQAAEDLPDEKPPHY